MVQKTVWPEKVGVVTGLPSFVSLSSGILVLYSDVLVSENTVLVDSVQFSSCLWQEGKLCTSLLFQSGLESEVLDLASLC